MLHGTPKNIKLAKVGLLKRIEISEQGTCTSARDLCFFIIKDLSREVFDANNSAGKQEQNKF